MYIRPVYLRISSHLLGFQNFTGMFQREQELRSKERLRLRYKLMMGLRSTEVKQYLHQGRRNSIHRSMVKKYQLGRPSRILRSTEVLRKTNG